MAFPSLSPTLAIVADRAVAWTKARYGAKGFKAEQAIDGSISWRPTYCLKPKQFEQLAVEVNDVIFPDVLKGAAHDIREYGALVRVLQVMPLDVFQADKDHKKVNALKAQGFGIITVAADGTVTMQQECVPLLQFISERDLEERLAGLAATVKVKLRQARVTYLTNPVQGVQDAGQLIEEMVTSLAKQSAAAAGLTSAEVGANAAALIDTLYNKPYFKDHRAALGGARSFLKMYRNPTSHAPKSAKEAAERVKKARDGFLSAVSHASLLTTAIRALGHKVIVHG